MFFINIQTPDRPCVTTLRSTAISGLGSSRRVIRQVSGGACYFEDYATEYPIDLKGVSHSMAMYYGYVAGKNALQVI